MFKVHAILLAVGLFAAGAQASPIFPTTLLSSSPATSGFEQIFAIDSSLWTDYASHGLGLATHLDFNFGAPVVLSSIRYTNRTSSGGANGSQYMGTFDFVTGFEYIFSNDINFNTVLFTVTDTAALPTCSPSCTTADLPAFQVTTPIGSGIAAQYVRWQVVGTDLNDTGAKNPGAADLSFNTAVPEPGSVVLMAIGILALATRKRLRNSN